MPQLPPRPHDIRVDDLDLCSVLDDADRALLGVFEGVYSSADAVIGDRCRWTHSPAEPIESFAVVRETRYGAVAALAAPRGATVEVIAGFATVFTQGIHDDPNRGCIALIDVTDRKALTVAYSYRGSSVPMTREIACGKARTAAELVMGTILAQG